ncbi:hypothetical protein [Candidatus Nitrososphaera sp. FF02]|uniref:hypothetical protein n=1 Tax=Candidatus Nitrososphaera sp. FF02 TaxID=3398226 RepID=UPI0039E82C79
MTLSPLFSLFKIIGIARDISNDAIDSSDRKKAGISPVIATTVILAITVSLGLALWSFANSGVSATTAQYADVITDYGKYASDRFVIVNVAYDYPLADRATVWVYNSGQLTTDVANILLTCKDCTGPFTAVSADASQITPTNPQLASKSLQGLSFATGTLADGNTYEITVTSGTGAYQVHYQAK